MKAAVQKSVFLGSKNRWRMVTRANLAKKDKQIEGKNEVEWQCGYLSSRPLCLQNVCPDIKVDSYTSQWIACLNTDSNFLNETL